MLDVHRFVEEWKKTASLDLRDGHANAIDTYHDRIAGGSNKAIIDTMYTAQTACRADTLAGSRPS
ncbi:hypothetical protein PSCLAVI8L_180066 [Pseudoclavibacter sp. 8L]|nr:hypothetical protein PSCLAVI8L_180066 [Pseudoclavibacter sp. 8L]